MKVRLRLAILVYSVAKRRSTFSLSIKMGRIQKNTYISHFSRNHKRLKINDDLRVRSFTSQEDLKLH